MMMNVKIYKTAKNAMQSGRAKTGQWVLEYDRKTARRPDALMGWSSAGDTCNQVKLLFETCDDAAAYATEKGWAFDIKNGTPKRIRPRNYGDNFRYFPSEDGK